MANPFFFTMSEIISDQHAEECESQTLARGPNFNCRAILFGPCGDAKSPLQFPAGCNFQIAELNQERTFIDKYSFH